MLFCQIVKVFSRNHPICSHYRGIQIKEVQISWEFTVNRHYSDTSALPEIGKTEFLETKTNEKVLYTFTYGLQANMWLYAWAEVPHLTKPPWRWLTNAPYALEFAVVVAASTLQKLSFVTAGPDTANEKVEMYKCVKASLLES